MKQKIYRYDASVTNVGNKTGPDEGIRDDDYELDAQRGTDESSESDEVPEQKENDIIADYFRNLGMDDPREKRK